MDKFQEELINKLFEVVDQDDITNLSIDFSGRVPKLLRAWADEIESGEISVKSAVITLNQEKDSDLQVIHIVTTNK